MDAQKRYICAPWQPRGLDARIVHTQHDEIMVEARHDVTGQVQKIVAGSMEEAFKRIVPEVPFVVELRLAEAWDDSGNVHRL